jgi:hypothetical protein
MSMNNCTKARGEFTRVPTQRDERITSLNLLLLRNVG